MKNIPSFYTIHSDGGSRGNPGPAAYGFVVYDDSKRIVHEEGKRIGITTNNVAEYQGVIAALRWVYQTEHKPKTISFFLDSELVASQLNGRYKIKNEHLRSLFFTVKELESKIEVGIEFRSIPREQNIEADRMVNLALNSTE